MPFTHSFAAVMPPPRYDDPAVSWSTIQIEQAPTVAGPWTLLEERAISLDPTPESPTPLDLTVISALETGWYRFRFKDDDLVVSAYSEPSESPSDVVGPSGYRPTLAQLGAIMRARTKDDDGIEQGTFTANTRPTASEAEALIDQALDVLSTRLGAVPRRLVGLARSLTALETAVYVELSYFPEETTQDQSAYERYREQFDGVFASYQAALEGGAIGDAPNQIHALRLTSFYTTPTRLDDPFDVYDPSKYGELLP